jgi:hypothetical protein
MFLSAIDHHQGVHVFLVKITELKCEYSYVAMWQHNIFCLYVVSGVVRHADCSRHASPHQTPRINTVCYAATSPHMNTHILIQ